MGTSGPGAIVLIGSGETEELLGASECGWQASFEGCLTSVDLRGRATGSAG